MDLKAVGTLGIMGAKNLLVLGCGLLRWHKVNLTVSPRKIRQAPMMLWETYTRN